MIEMHNYNDIKDMSSNKEVLIADESHMLKEPEHKWTIVMIYPKEVESSYTPGTFFNVFVGQKCADVESLSIGCRMLDSIIKVAYPNHEFVVIPYTEDKFDIEIEHRHDMWTFNAKGEARPAWFRTYLSNDAEPQVRVCERIKSDPCPHVGVGDLVRIVFDHGDEETRDTVRRVLALHPDKGYAADGSRCHGLIDYEILPTDKPHPDGTFFNTCNISWITEVIERSNSPKPVVNYMHRHWKRSSLLQKQWANEKADQPFSRGRVDDAFYEPRPLYSIQESVRYILNRQATIDRAEQIDWEKMLAQLTREMYPGCHFVTTTWYRIERTELEVKQWKKFRKWVLKNHRKWVTALLLRREAEIQAAKEDEKRQMADMDRDFEYLDRHRHDSDDDDTTDEGSFFDDEEDRVSDHL